MTTKFLDNEICKSKIRLSWCFSNKTMFWTISLFAPNALTPPLKTANFIFFVVSPSLIEITTGSAVI